MHSQYTDSLARISFPDPRRKAITVLLAVGLCVAGILVLTSCSGLSEQSPAAHSAILRSKSFLQKQTNLKHVVLSAELPAGTTGVAYQGRISIRRGTAPYEFSIVNGGLPPGLQLDRSTGKVSGLPGTVGIYQFQVSAIDSAGSAGIKVLSIEIQSGSSSPDVSITISPSTTTLPSGDKTQFTSAIRGTNNVSVIWTATLGTVSSTGLFTAPTVRTSTTATVTSTSVADQSEKASATVTITAPGAINRPVIASTSLPQATSGVAYSATLIVTGGKPPYSWSASSGSLPQGLALNSSTGIISGTTMQAGNFSFQAKVTDSALQSTTKNLSLSVSVPTTTGTPNGFDGPAELPRVYVKSALADTPALGRRIGVNADGDLQAALNSANCGDTIELHAGATFSGRYVLPAKACDDQHWIVIRTDASDASLPPEGTRLTPCYAGVPALPGRPALNCSNVQNVLAKIVFPSSYGSGPLVLASGANHYRLLGLEITRAVGSGSVGGLLQIQRYGVADHVVVDRVWLHGTAQDETGHGIHLNGASYFAVVDSYFNDFHCISVSGACTDAQAIVGGSGTVPSGVFKVAGNFLEASGESILFGGGPATVTPADIEIRRNHLFKPLQWMRGASGFVGGISGNPFIVKNHMELKNAQRVLFEGNVLENTWGGFSQSGYSILLTPKNQALNGTSVCPVCQVTDVTIRYSTISHVGGGLQIATVLSDTAGMALAGARFSIHDITLDDISAQHYVGSGTLVGLFNGWSRNVLNDVTLNHITGFPDHHMLTLLDVAPNPVMSGLKFTNSILGATAYPVWSAGGGSSNCAYSNVPVTSLSMCFDSYTFTDNALIGASSSYPSSKWPSGNFFLAAASDAQFVNYSSANGGDYHVLPTSPCNNAASDGKDLGADIDAIQTAILGVY